MTFRDDLWQSVKERSEDLTDEDIDIEMHKLFHALTPEEKNKYYPKENNRMKNLFGFSLLVLSLSYLAYDKYKTRLADCPNHADCTHFISKCLPGYVPYYHCCIDPQRQDEYEIAQKAADYIHRMDYNCAYNSNSIETKELLGRYPGLNLTLLFSESQFNIIQFATQAISIEPVYSPECRWDKFWNMENVLKIIGIIAVIIWIVIISIFC